MVSADNLNLDVLELIFAYISGSGNDLASVALVSRSFLAGVVPRLYRTLLFRLNQAKRYPMVMSPFAAILAHPELAVHVRHVDIRTVPILKSQLHPIFIRECTRALGLCKNLSSFKCTVNSLPPFLLCLQGKERLQDVRVHANLTTDQATKLINLTNLRDLALDFGSWNVMDLLPKWTKSVQRTLTSLTLYMTSELNEHVLESALSQLPKLIGLHVIGCPKVDHVAILRLVSYTPILESLSFTTTEAPRDLVTPPSPLHHLRHLALDTRYTLLPSPTPSVLTSILSHLNSSTPLLTSFTIKLSDRQILIGHAFIQQLVGAHALTLTRFAFVNCTVGMDSITLICRTCVNLERLEVAVPVKEIAQFTAAVSRSFSLHTLVDMGDSHITHGPRLSLTQENVRYMMSNVRNLKKIVNDSRIWTGSRAPSHELVVSLERRRGHAAETHWFVPRPN